MSKALVEQDALMMEPVEDNDECDAEVVEDANVKDDENEEEDEEGRISVESVPPLVGSA
jgi:hypothetical protein